MIDTPAALAAWLPRLAAQERVAIRVEPTGHVAVQAEIAGLAFAWAPGEAFYLPLVAPASAARLERDATLAALRTFFENPQQQKISRNLKHDMILLAAAGIESAGMAFDTMLASYLLDAGERNHTLAELAQRYLDHALVKPGQVTGTGSLEKRPDELPVAAVANLVGEETDAALRLAPILVDRLREDDLERLFDELEIPLIEVLAAMERTGVRSRCRAPGRSQRRVWTPRGDARSRDLRAGQPGIQYCLAQAIAAGVIHRTEAAGIAAD